MGDKGWMATAATETVGLRAYTPHPHGGCHGDQWSQMWLMEQGIVWVSGGSGIMPGEWAESRAPVPTPARPWTHPGLDLLT